MPLRPNPVPASLPRWPLAAVALAVQALCAGSALAQASGAAQASEVIQVTGLRASLESALNKKREDSGIVDVIKAEDVAKFPDTNLAKSLQRIPGVVFDRDAGEPGRGRGRR